MINDINIHVIYLFLRVTEYVTNLDVILIRRNREYL